MKTNQNSKLTSLAKRLATSAALAVAIMANTASPVLAEPPLQNESWDITYTDDWSFGFPVEVQERGRVVNVYHRLGTGEYRQEIFVQIFWTLTNPENGKTVSVIASNPSSDSFGTITSYKGAIVLLDGNGAPVVNAGVSEWSWDTYELTKVVGTAVDSNAFWEALIAALQ